MTPREQLNDAFRFFLFVAALLGGAGDSLHTFPLSVGDTMKVRTPATRAPQTGGKSDAILTGKKYNGTSYTVLVTCSRCRHASRVGFAGWAAIACGGCGAEMNRTKYRPTTRG